MKFAVLILDGVADRPLDAMGGKTPLMAALCPHMDSIVAMGLGGRAKFIPDGLPAGSDVAVLSIAGFDPAEFYSGRGPLEAFAQGIDVGVDQIAYRCNLVTIANGLIDDYSSGHIRSPESHELIKSLARALNSDKVTFCPGVDYRHLLLVKDLAAAVTCPPHDHVGEKIDDFLPSGPGSELLLELMEKSAGILEDHPVNKERVAAGDKPANAIWPWSGGKPVPMISLRQRFGLTGAVITAVDLVRGIGRASGLEVIEVPGATGLWDTNYTGKADAAMEALESMDFVLLHVEATDEAGHMGRADLKIQAIQDFDSLIVGPLLEFMRRTAEPWRILVTPDHPTPIDVRTHTRDWVPFAMAGTGIEPDHKAETFDESLTLEGFRSFDRGHLLLEKFINAGD